MTYILLYIDHFEGLYGTANRHVVIYNGTLIELPELLQVLP